MTAERTTRVAERIRAELMDLLLKGEVKDPAVRDAIVHAVKVTPDLQHARIYVRLGTLEPTERRKAALMKGLERASGFMRRTLGKRLKLRYTPSLTFFWDDTAETAARIESILDDLDET